MPSLDHWFRTVFCLLFAAVLPAGVPAALPAQTVEWSGQIRPRFEFRDPTTSSLAAGSFTSARTRVTALGRLDRGVWGLAQIQDVRIWGEEGNTLSDFSADGLDVHQAFLQIGAEDAARSLRVGRFEQNYGGQRLIGAVGWTQQGRAFDGVRGRLGTRAGLSADAFVFQLGESLTPARSDDSWFGGAYGVVEVAPNQSLDLYALFLREDRSVAPDTEVLTAGARYVGAAGGWSYRFEGTLQTGERSGRDVSAWMAGARVGRTLSGRGTLTLWYDHLSGNAPGETDDGSFDTLFGTNHKFYGYADLFLNVPAHTDGRGLRDFALKSSWTLADRWTASVDLHRFEVSERAELDTALLGHELDVVVTHPFTPGLTISGGAARVIAGDALGPVRGIDQDVTFAYVMFDLAFR